MSDEQEKNKDNLTLEIMRKIRTSTFQIQHHNLDASRVNNTNLMDVSQQKTSISNSFNKMEENKLQTYADNSNHDYSKQDNSFHDNSKTIERSFNRSLNYKDNNNRLLHKSTVVIVTQSKPTLTNCCFYNSRLIFIDGRSTKTKSLPPKK